VEIPISVSTPIILMVFVLRISLLPTRDNIARSHTKALQLSAIRYFMSFLVNIVFEESATNPAFVNL
jgi:hypothetical protein